jgi:hypothetical protein
MTQIHTHPAARQPTVTPVERDWLRLERMDDETGTAHGDDLLGALLGATIGMVVGFAAAAVWLAVAGGSPAMVIAITTVVGIAVGVVLGGALLAARDRAAEREFAQLRERALVEPPLRRLRR